MRIAPDTVACVDIGTVLANGAVVVQASSIRPIEEGMLAYGIVMARTVSGAWATWAYNLDRQATHSGNYFGDLKEADEDYRKRCRKHGLRAL